MSEFENFFKDVHEYKDKELTLSRIDNAIVSIGLNEADLGKIIHIAGSNGKGSTAFFISQFLKNAGYKVALFTSPHIMKINERITVDGYNISDNEFDNLFKDNKDIIERYSLTYFEAIFILSLIYFKNSKVDFTILETGLGGRYDATNCSAINNKISVITKIAQDHTDVFGKNIFVILNEKLGIVRESSPLFIGINTDEITAKILQSVTTKDIFITKNDSFADNSFQHPYNENYAVAKNVVSYILKTDIEDKILELPKGRYEVYKKTIIDSTHNISGLLAIKKTELIKDIDVIIFTQTKERNLKKFAEILKTITDKIILTTIPNSERSMHINNVDDNDIMKFENPLDAYKYARGISAKKVLIIGSFYLIAFYKSVLLADEL